jgi:hypothetical protein
MLQHSSGRKADAYRRINLPMIEASRTSRKTTILNFARICQRLHRDQAHVKQYPCTEQNLEASQDANGALICQGRLTQPMLEKSDRGVFWTLRQVSRLRVFKHQFGEAESAPVHRLRKLHRQDIHPAD